MRKVTLGAVALAVLGLGAPQVGVLAPVPAHAQQRADQAAARAFVDRLARDAFQVLRGQGSRDQVRGQFRQMLRQNFAVEQIGDRLIRRHRAQITPQQYQAYMAAFPDFVINTYADRLYEYANADFRVIRTVPRGRRGDVDVYSRVTLPDRAQPIDAVWSVRPVAGAPGRFQVTNLTVAGVNLALTQEADFTSYIQRNGFDALVQFMRNGKGEPA